MGKSLGANSVGQKSQNKEVRSHEASLIQLLFEASVTWEAGYSGKLTCVCVDLRIDTPVLFVRNVVAPFLTETCFCEILTYTMGQLQSLQVVSLMNEKCDHFSEF